ncbi:MAG: 2-C-methyl-D-erythritol 4-phosphate cytidylyltransferase [Clostridiales bacterium]|jgi:2-C-methyl-D-erythritol 4-phosphate cytidylyltransferase|nr:2-C-methyl-D-erythritol 4-phosphate cytidylyltransferase [Clostridiales bacterium]
MPYQERNVTAIIAAGGRGARMNAGQPKQFLPLAGKPILARTLMVFAQCACVDEIVIAAPEDWIPFIERNILAFYGLGKASATPGGDTRQRSVYKGLQAARGDLILIHDAARPLITHDDIAASLEAAVRDGACAPGVPLMDTVKVRGADGMARPAPPRETLWRIQTPQAFAAAVIREAHENAARDAFEATDDAALVERMGRPVQIIPGREANVKITTEDDLLWCEYRLRRGSGVL